MGPSTAWWRRRPATALVAAAVTALVAVPMLTLALGAGPADRVPADGLDIAAATGGGAALDGATIASASLPSIVVDVDAVAVAWALAPAGEATIVEGTDRLRPFVIDTGPVELSDGRYELLVTAVDDDGVVLRRAARFAVGGDSDQAAP